MNKKERNRETLRKAAVSTVPVMAGYLVLGIAFGILLADKGYSPVWALLMSTAIYAGSMQFVTVNLLTGGASLVSAAVMTLLVNARQLIYAVSMLTKYRNMGKAKPYLVFALTDETYALLCTPVPENVNQKVYYLTVSVLNQLYWILGSVLGGVIGAALTINTAGIDFAMTALFTVIFTQQWIANQQHLPAVLGVGITLLCLLIFGPDAFLIPAMVLLLLCLTAMDYWKTRREKKRDA